MQPLNIPDHDTYWKDDADMRAQTKAYMEWAKAVTDTNNETELFGSGIRHPWQEDGFDIDAKVQIFEVRGDHLGEEQPAFNDAKDLLMHWENTPKDGTWEKTNRRIIILQDMHPRIIELLGVKLGIPPHFFLAHCDGFVDLHLINSAYAKQDSSTYWRVPVPRRRYVPDDLPPGDYYIEAGNFNRQELEIQQGVENVSLRSLVSYWGKSYGPDSWTAVILIDPHETYVRPKNPTGVPNRYECTDISFVRQIFLEVMVTSDRSDTLPPYRRSTFDAAVEAYSSNTVLDTKDPFTGTLFVRNIIRSSWEDSIVRRAEEVHDMLVDDQTEYQRRRNITFDARKSRSNPSSRGVDPSHAYQILMLKRQAIQEEKDIIDSIIWKFRCKEVSIPLQERDRPRDPDTSKEHDKPQHHDTLQDLLKEERKSWTMMYEKLCRMESTIADHMEMWSQRAALEQEAASFEQTLASNRIARTSGQLTKIATIIVPCTFVASIFSMGGQFAAGEDRFYVYWATSIPVTLVLLSWVLYGDIKESYETALGRVKTKKQPDTKEQDTEKDKKRDALRHWVQSRLNPTVLKKSKVESVSA